MWLHSVKVAQLLRSVACLHTNQSRSYLNHLVCNVVALFTREASLCFSISIVRQSTATIRYRHAAPARISPCLLCAVTQTNVNVSPATQGLSCQTSPCVQRQHNILYQQVQLSATDLSECECVPSNTRALTPNLTFCSTTTRYIVPTGTTKYDALK